MNSSLSGPSLALPRVMEALSSVISNAGAFIEAIGVFVVIVGAFVAFWFSWRERRTSDAYRNYRRYFGHAILLGLEFLVAADIIRTVSHTPSISDVLALGGIVLIRTFLSISLQVEIDGRWPWQT